MNLAVGRLQIHLPNRQQVRFYKQQNINDVLNNDNNSKTMLTQFFALDQRNPESKTFLYREIPEHYCWNNRHKEWYPRGQCHHVGKRAFLPRIKHKITESANLPFCAYKEIIPCEIEFYNYYK